MGVFPAFQPDDLLFERLVGHSRQSRAEQRSDDEDPEAGERRQVPGKGRDQRRTEAAGRVDGGAGQADAQDVDAGQRQVVFKEEKPLNSRWSDFLLKLCQNAIESEVFFFP